MKTKTDDWIAACGQYVIELDRIIEAINERLANLRLSTIESAPNDIHAGLESLSKLLQTLERMVVHRDELIRHEDAPPGGFNLGEKLLSLRTSESVALAAQVKQLGSRIDDTNGRAVSLFVCQYHLQELTRDIIRTLSRDTSSQTYDANNSHSAAPARPAAGSLFNDAA